MGLLSLGCIAAVVTCAAGFTLRWAGRRFDLRSDPCQLKYYADRRPLFGGLAVALGFWAGVAALYVARGGALGDVYFTEEAARGMLAALGWATVFLVLPTCLSDRRQDTGYYEWLYVLASAAFIASDNMAIEAISIPSVGVVTLGPWTSVLLTVLWVAIVVSIVEVLESIGGAVTLAPILLASLIFYVWSSTGEIVQRGLNVAFVGSLIGILPAQRVRDGIVLGKAGNKVVGFLFAALTIVGRRKAGTTQFLILPLFIFILYVVVHGLMRFERRTQKQ